MLRLLTIEFHKLKHNTASKVLSIIYFGLLISIALIAAIKFDIGPIKFHLAEMGIFNFPYIWHFNPRTVQAGQVPPRWRARHPEPARILDPTGRRFQPARLG